MRDRDEYSADLDKQDVTGRPLTRREQKQQEKYEKQAEAIRRQQEALEAKHREALEKETARQARIQEKQEEKLRRLEYVKEVAVYEEDKTVTGEFYLDTMEYPDAPERLQEDVRLFNSSMPSCKNIQKVKLRSAPFEKTTTMKIKRYLLAQPAGKR